MGYKESRQTEIECLDSTLFHRLPFHRAHLQLWIVARVHREADSGRTDQLFARDSIQHKVEFSNFHSTKFYDDLEVKITTLILFTLNLSRSFLVSAKET